eukprot:6182652-Pleurochrysis_carterae.AAC.1
MRDRRSSPRTPKSGQPCEAAATTVGRWKNGGQAASRQAGERADGETSRITSKGEPGSQAARQPGSLDRLVASQADRHTERRRPTV